MHISRLVCEEPNCFDTFLGEEQPVAMTDSQRRPRACTAYASSSSIATSRRSWLKKRHHRTRCPLTRSNSMWRPCRSLSRGAGAPALSHARTAGAYARPHPLVTRTTVRPRLLVEGAAARSSSLVAETAVRLRLLVVEAAARSQSLATGHAVRPLSHVAKAPASPLLFVVGESARPCSQWNLRRHRQRSEGHCSLLASSGLWTSSPRQRQAAMPMMATSGSRKHR